MARLEADAAVAGFRSREFAQKQRPARTLRGPLLLNAPTSEHDLQGELEDARLESAGDLSAAARNASGDCREGRCGAGAQSRVSGDGALASADVPGQIEVSVVEDVVGLGTELDFQGFDRSAECLVQ